MDVIDWQTAGWWIRIRYDRRVIELSISIQRLFE